MDIEVEIEDSLPTPKGPISSSNVVSATQSFRPAPSLRAKLSRENLLPAPHDDIDVEIEAEQKPPAPTPPQPAPSILQLHVSPQSSLTNTMSGPEKLASVSPPSSTRPAPAFSPHKPPLPISRTPRLPRNASGTSSITVPEPSALPNDASLPISPQPPTRTLSSPFQTNANTPHPTQTVNLALLTGPALSPKPPTRSFSSPSMGAVASGGCQAQANDFQLSPVPTTPTQVTSMPLSANIIRALSSVPETVSVTKLPKLSDGNVMVIPEHDIEIEIDDDRAKSARKDVEQHSIRSNTRPNIGEAIEVEDGIANKPASAGAGVSEGKKEKSEEIPEVEDHNEEHYEHDFEDDEHSGMKNPGKSEIPGQIPPCVPDNQTSTSVKDEYEDNFSENEAKIPKKVSEPAAPSLSTFQTIKVASSHSGISGNSDSKTPLQNPTGKEVRKSDSSPNSVPIPTSSASTPPSLPSLAFALTHPSHTSHCCPGCCTASTCVYTHYMASLCPGPASALGGSLRTVQIPVKKTVKAGGRGNEKELKSRRSSMTEVNVNIPIDELPQNTIDVTNKNVEVFNTVYTVVPHDCLHDRTRNCGVVSSCSHHANGMYTQLVQINREFQNIGKYTKSPAHPVGFGSRSARFKLPHMRYECDCVQVGGKHTKTCASLNNSEKTTEKKKSSTTAKSSDSDDSDDEKKPTNSTKSRKSRQFTPSRSRSQVKAHSHSEKDDADDRVPVPGNCSNPHCRQHGHGRYICPSFIDFASKHHEKQRRLVSSSGNTEKRNSPYQHLREYYGIFSEISTLRHHLGQKPDLRLPLASIGKQTPSSTRKSVGASLASVLSHPTSATTYSSRKNGDPENGPCQVHGHETHHCSAKHKKNCRNEYCVLHHPENVKIPEKPSICTFYGHGPESEEAERFWNPEFPDLSEEEKSRVEREVRQHYEETDATFKVAITYCDKDTVGNCLWENDITPPKDWEKISLSEIQVQDVVSFPMLQAVGIMADSFSRNNPEKALTFPNENIFSSQNPASNDGKVCFLDGELAFGRGTAIAQGLIDFLDGKPEPRKVDFPKNHAFSEKDEYADEFEDEKTPESPPQPPCYLVQSFPNLLTEAPLLASAAYTASIGRYIRYAASYTNFKPPSLSNVTGPQEKLLGMSPYAFPTSSGANSMSSFNSVKPSPYQEPIQQQYATNMQNVPMNSAATHVYARPGYDTVGSLSDGHQQPSYPRSDMEPSLVSQVKLHFPPRDESSGDNLYKPADNLDNDVRPSTPVASSPHSNRLGSARPGMETTEAAQSPLPLPQDLHRPGTPQQDSYNDDRNSENVGNTLPPPLSSRPSTRMTTYSPFHPSNLSGKIDSAENSDQDLPKPSYLPPKAWTTPESTPRKIRDSGNSPITAASPRTPRKNLNFGSNALPKPFIKLQRPRCDICNYAFADVRCGPPQDSEEKSSEIPDDAVNLLDEDEMMSMLSQLNKISLADDERGVYPKGSLRNFVSCCNMNLCQRDFDELHASSVMRHHIPIPIEFTKTVVYENRP